MLLRVGLFRHKALGVRSIMVNPNPEPGSMDYG